MIKNNLNNYNKYNYYFTISKFRITSIVLMIIIIRFYIFKNDVKLMIDMVILVY